jgi:hypothetical protein
MTCEVVKSIVCSRRRPPTAAEDDEETFLGCCCFLRNHRRRRFPLDPLSLLVDDDDDDDDDDDLDLLVEPPSDCVSTKNVRRMVSNSIQSVVLTAACEPPPASDSFVGIGAAVVSAVHEKWPRDESE